MIILILSAPDLEAVVLILGSRAPKVETDIAFVAWEGVIDNFYDTEVRTTRNVNIAARLN